MNRSTLLLVPLALVTAQTANAQQQSLEDASAACKEAARLIEEDDLAGALDEAQWCVESLQQLKQQRTLTLFPDTVDGFSGGEISNQSAMGMTVIEREYVKGDQAVNVSLTGGVAGGGLAALAQLGMGLGASGSGQKFRVQRRTVVNMSQPNSDSEYMVQMKSGGMLAIKSEALNEEELLEFVKAFPIADLDDALVE